MNNTGNLMEFDEQVPQRVMSKHRKHVVTRISEKHQYNMNNVITIFVPNKYSINAINMFNISIYIYTSEG